MPAHGGGGLTNVLGSARMILARAAPDRVVGVRGLRGAVEHGQTDQAKRLGGGEHSGGSPEARPTVGVGPRVDLRDAGSANRGSRGARRRFTPKCAGEMAAGDAAAGFAAAQGYRSGPPGRAGIRSALTTAGYSGTDRPEQLYRKGGRIRDYAERP